MPKAENDRPGIGRFELPQVVVLWCYIPGPFVQVFGQIDDGFADVRVHPIRSLTRQCIAGRRFGDIETLQAEITDWSTDVTKTQRGVDWQMRIDDARCKLKSVYPKIKV